MMNRISRFKYVLWIILGIAAAVGVTRFIFGLGVTTNLTDNTPWGFWIGFDVMGGVALAAGGFVIAAINYIFDIKAFKPVARAAILTAFIGYIAVAVGLLFDLGLPWNIWHMIIFWNPHSPLFEVGWCVMLYLTVLTLEFAPVVLEKFPNINFLRSIYNFLYKLRIPLVILGIMLSTLHQSSLGSLFLAMPYRLHPLWYSPIIPIIFFVSAICLGLMMVMVESMTSSWLYRKEQETNIVKKLSKIAIWMLIIYAVLKFADIFVRGAGEFLFLADWGTYLFWIEIFISIIIPIVAFSLARRDINWLYLGALSGVIGVVFNRLNVGGLTHLNNLTETGTFYFPSWTELMISAGVVSAAMLVFFYFVENFKVWEEPPKDDDLDPKVKPRFDANRVYIGPQKAANRSRFSLAFVIAFSLGFAFISGEEIYSKGLEKVRVEKARGGDTLFIDGNRDGYGVAFKHKYHEDMGYDCARCHHMNVPGDESTGCWECHYYMYTEGDAFNHDWHASPDGASLNCYECHKEGMHKSACSAEQKVADCRPCHEDIIPPYAYFKIENYVTPSYVDALHNMCINCHRERLAIDSSLKARKPELALCITCHPEGQETDYEKSMFLKQQKKKWVVLPGKMDK